MKKAIILAAGMGLRLNPVTNNNPKCLIDVNGKSILKRELECLEQNGIKETVIVIGYMAEKIVDVIGGHFGKMKIGYIENRLFNKTNNIYSLWRAKEQLKDGCVLIEGDVVFENEILTNLLNTDKDKSYWVVDKFSEGMNGCILTTRNNGSEIQSINIVRGGIKDINPNCFKSVGVLKLTPEFCFLFTHLLDHYIRKGVVGVYYDIVLADHINGCKIYACPTNGLKWFEIDDANDLKRARAIFKNLE